MLEAGVDLLVLQAAYRVDRAQPRRQLVRLLRLPRKLLAVQLQSLRQLLLRRVFPLPVRLPLLLAAPPALARLGQLLLRVLDHRGRRVQLLVDVSGHGPVAATAATPPRSSRSLGRRTQVCDGGLLLVDALLQTRHLQLVQDVVRTLQGTAAPDVEQGAVQRLHETPRVPVRHEQRGRHRGHVGGDNGGRRAEAQRRHGLRLRNGGGRPRGVRAVRRRSGGRHDGRRLVLAQRAHQGACLQCVRLALELDEGRSALAGNLDANTLDGCEQARQLTLAPPLRQRDGQTRHLLLRCAHRTGKRSRREELLQLCRHRTMKYRYCSF
eukprot:Rhum_TRINITY_DN12444_c0_g2::Rhum_TRINITY_DN12444_c0_g2_i1::g.51950::m.51950